MFIPELQAVIPEVEMVIAAKEEVVSKAGAGIPTDGDALAR